MCVKAKPAFWKFLLHVLIIVNWGGGLVNISTGVYLILNDTTSRYPSIFMHYDTYLWLASIYLLLVSGFCILIVGVVGCYGSNKPMNSLLWIFNILMAIFAAMQLIVVVMAGIFENDVTVNLKESMEYQLVFDYVDEKSPDAVSKDWNSLQKDLLCCGSNYYVDYKLYSNFYKKENRSVPQTCCDMDNDEQLYQYETCLRESDGYVAVDNIRYLNRYGCFGKLFLLLEIQTTLIVTTGCLLSLVQIGCVFVGCLLRENLNRTGSFLKVHRRI